jgi:hypothetical protein
MIDLSTLDEHRVIDRDVMLHYGDAGDSTCGAFRLKSPIDGQVLRIIASSGGGWDHVSVSRERRIPNQIEMDFVFRHFFRDGETAVQFFLPRDQHVNIHPNCLHLWRARDRSIPLPPIEFV